MIKNIVFDMGGVLIRWDPAWMIGQLDLPEEDAALFNREVFRSIHWVRHDRGALDEAALEQTLASHLPQRLHSALHRMVYWYDEFLSPIPGMAELVAELKGKGYHIFLLSNAGVDLRSYFPKIPGSQWFDGLMVSAEEHIVKPDLRLYDRLSQRFDLCPGESFFTDDNPSNVEGAMEAGFHGAVFHGDVAALRRALAQASVEVRTDEY